MNSKISLIIPIKGREEFTFRILSYLDSIKYPFKIYISDGSHNKKENIKIIKSFKSSLNIQYLSFKYDKNYQYFLNKIYKTLKLIKSKYVMLLPNDDFINLNFLNKILKNKNETISGINIDFKINNFMKYSNDFGKIKFYEKIKREYNQNLKKDDKFQRLKYINSFHPYESIHLHKILLKVLRYSLDFKVNNHKEFMWFFKLVPLYFSKINFVNRPIIARQANTYLSEGNTLHYKENSSSKKRHEKFKSFIFLKIKNKKIHSLINEQNFEFIYEINIKRKLMIFLISIKSFLSLMISNLYISRNKYDIKNYNKLFLNINKKFKIQQSINFK